MKKIIPWILVPVAIFLVFIIVSYTKRCNERSKLEQLYREGLKVVYDKSNPFCPEAEYTFYDSMSKNTSNTESRQMIVEFFKAVTLLKLGEEQRSVNLLESLYNRLKPEMQGAFPSDVRKNLAIAYLRLGERQNCISNHSMGSCIFPIMGSGVYTESAPTYKGIEIYKQLLKMDTSDNESRWLLNLAYMTVGTYPDKVPPAMLIPGMDTDTGSYKVKAFTDRSMNLKLNNFKSQAGGAITDDFDNDGYLDIITSSWGLEESMHYFKNKGDGTFEDVSKKSGLDKIKGGLNIIQADYNNDGYTDILVLRGAWQREFGKQPNTLLKNNGDGTFTDVTVESGLLSFHPTQTATWADFNNDGWLDLFIGNETSSAQFPHPSELYINNRDGSFTNVSAEAGCDVTGFVKGVTSADYNNDGWPDIFVSKMDGGKILLKNKGIKGDIPQFENATHEAGLDKDVTFTFPTWFWDYDNDGWPDIFVCGYLFNGSLAAVAGAEGQNKYVGNASKMYLYHNNHNGTFTNVSQEAGLDRPVFAMGANFGDIDNDGWLDMYLGTGNPDFRSLVPNRMFKNIDGKKFAEVTASARVGNLQKGHGVAFADLDNDGDQDIFLEVGGAYKGDAYYNSLFVNPGQNNNKWISVQLEGVNSNRSAIGARIAVTFTEEGIKRTVYRDVNSGGSFGSSPLRKEIGIGKAKMIDELIIKWPTTGTVQVFKDITPGQFLKIKEGSDHLEKIKLKTLNFNQGEDRMNMISCAPSLPVKTAPLVQ